MRIEAKSGTQEKEFMEIAWGHCFMFKHELWFKGKTTSVRLRDGESRDFGENVMVTSVKAKVIYESQD